MLTSIIEKLNSKEDYLTFPEWISKENKKEELKKRGLSLWDEYNKIYGKTVVNGRYHQHGVGSNPTYSIPLISVREQSVPVKPWFGLGISLVRFRRCRLG